MFLIISIILAAIVAGAALVWRGWGKDSCGRGENHALLVPGYSLIGLAGTTLFILAMLWPIQYFTSLSAVNEMRAFQDSRATIIGAIEKAKDVEIAGAGSVDGSLVDLTYQQQSRSYTDLVANCRDRVAEYNENYRLTTALKEVPFFGQMRVGVPDDLQPITGDFCTGGEG